jgi:redox-sensitive bicupin YhaK (pirin superfamily)
MNIRKSNERGHADHGWLKSHHTFSFASYYEPDFLGFRSLRVINQDTVAPTGGFGTHPHADMEIFSYVLEGTLKHEDSMGNGCDLKPGQIQLMSAGTGVTHSEFNPSSSEPLHFLQIWIHPEKKGLTPNYTEWHPGEANEGQGKVLIISEDGREDSATIHQDASVYRIRLEPGETMTHNLAEGRGLWLQNIHGNVAINATELAAGDAASTEEAATYTLTAKDAPVEALLFDLK